MHLSRPPEQSSAGFLSRLIRKRQQRRQSEEAPKETDINISTLVTLDLVDKRPSTRTPMSLLERSDLLVAILVLRRLRFILVGQRTQQLSLMTGYMWERRWEEGAAQGAGQDKARRHQ